MYSQTENYEKALADYNRAAEINPNNVLIYYNRAAVFLQKNNIRSAIADYSKAIELYPDFANAYLNRSYAKRKNNDTRGAKIDYDIAQKKIAEHQRKMHQSGDETSFADTSRQYSNLVAFDADFGNKDFATDLLQYQRADITLQPMYRLSVGTLAQVEKDYNKMYFNDQWEQWQRQNSTLSLNIVPHNPQRTADERKQWTQRADQIIDSLSYRNGVGYFAKAALLAEQNMYNTALNFYKQAIAIERDNPFYHFAYSVAQSEMIDFISSIDQQQTTTIVMGSNSTAALQNKMSNENKNYDYTAAIEELNRTIALLPSFAYAYYNRGNLKCHSNRMPEAIEDYTAAIERYPYFADAYYNRGLIQIYLHDTDKGCLDMSKAGELGVKSAYNVIKRYCKTP
jgi:tetratricopeptide (TPR) repeat protein